MIPGNYLLRRCSACSGKIAWPMFVTMHLSETLFWTDGYAETLGAPIGKPLIRCPRCRAFIWAYELEEAGEAPRTGIARDEKPFDKFIATGVRSFEDDIAMIEIPTFQDYAEACSSSFISENAEKTVVSYAWDVSFITTTEKHIRLNAWHTGNHPRRFGNPDAASPLSQEERSNLLALLGMLDTTGKVELLLKAECLRELGKFEEARGMLRSSFGAYANIARTIGLLTQRESRTVGRIEYKYFVYTDER